MKVNWKTVSKSKGYISLKAALIHDLQEGSRSKKELYSLFNWVIGRAKHYAHVREIPLEEVLFTWEAARDYWWLNYYGECNQPKLRKAPNVRPLGARAYKKDLKKWYASDPKLRIKLWHKSYGAKSEKQPARWSRDQKYRYKLMKKYL